MTSTTHHLEPAGDDAARTASSGAPDAPAVVLVHGMRTSSAIWSAQVAALHEAGIGARAVDLPGHGVRFDDRFSLDAAFDVVDDAFAELTADRPGAPLVLVGLSLGGYTSLAYAARHRDRLEGRLQGVVAAACSTETYGAPLRMFGSALRGGLAAQRVTRELGGRVRDSFDRSLGRWAVPEPLRAVRPGALPALVGPALPVVTHRTPGWDLVADAVSDLAGQSSRRNLRRVGVPVWLVNGERDQLRRQQHHLVRTAPGTQLVVVPGAGHDVSVEAPDAFNAAMFDALAAFAR